MSPDTSPLAGADDFDELFAAASGDEPAAAAETEQVESEVPAPEVQAETEQPAQAPDPVADAEPAPAAEAEAPAAEAQEEPVAAPAAEAAAPAPAEPPPAPALPADDIREMFGRLEEQMSALANGMLRLNDRQNDLEERAGNLLALPAAPAQPADEPRAAAPPAPFAEAQEAERALPAAPQVAEPAAAPVTEEPAAEPAATELEPLAAPAAEPAADVPAAPVDDEFAELFDRIDDAAGVPAQAWEGLGDEPVAEQPAAAPEAWDTLSPEPAAEEPAAAPAQAWEALDEEPVAQASVPAEQAWDDLASAPETTAPATDPWAEPAQAAAPADPWDVPTGAEPQAEVPSAEAASPWDEAPGAAEPWDDAAQVAGPAPADAEPWDATPGASEPWDDAQGSAPAPADAEPWDEAPAASEPWDDASAGTTDWDGTGGDFSHIAPEVGDAPATLTQLPVDLIWAIGEQNSAQEEVQREQLALDSMRRQAREATTPRASRRGGAKPSKLPFNMLRPGDPMIIAIYSPKGGAGKSTTAVNLGAYLADSGRRMAAQDRSGAEAPRICVIDGDIGNGNLAIRVADRTEPNLLNLQEWMDAHDGNAPEDYDSPDERVATIRDFMLWTPELPNLNVLAAPSNAEAYNDFQVADYEHLLRQLGKHFDVIILDCGTEIVMDSTKTWLRFAHQVFLLTLPERAALHSAGKAARLIARPTNERDILVTPDKLNIVMMRSDADLGLNPEFGMEKTFPWADSQNTFYFRDFDLEAGQANNRGSFLALENQDYNDQVGALAQIAFRNYRATAQAAAR